MILDSDILIAAFRGDRLAQKKLAELEQLGTRLATTTVTSFELYSGAEGAENPTQSLRQVDEFIQSIEIQNFDIAASKIAGRILHKLRSAGKLIDLPDIMIASIAVSRSEPVVTRNTKHFKLIDKLHVIEW